MHSFIFERALLMAIRVCKYHLSRIGLLLAASCVACSPAQAAECLQEQAIYADATGAYEVRFEPIGSASAATSNHFKLVYVKTGLTLDGIVMQSGEPVRPNAMAMYKCPEGDATGDEIAACTIWQGVIYAVAADGRIDPLPEEGSPAATHILLPDLGPSIRASAIWGKTTVAPWDGLSLTGCGS